MRTLTAFSFPLFFLLTLMQSTLAYDHDILAEDIGLNDVRIGTIFPGTPEQTYLFTAQAGLRVEFDILVADGNLNPALSITLNHVPLEILTGLDDERHLKRTFTFEAAGTYSLTISGLDGNGGVFAFAIREAAPVQADVPLTVGSTTIYSLARDEAATFNIQADSQSSLIINIGVENTTRSASVILKTADGNIVGSIGTAMFGGGFVIPSGTESYTLEIQNTAEGSAPMDFEVSVAQGR